ncbi:MAG: GNAT family protein, partial [Ruthenibacterium sp.]
AVKGIGSVYLRDIDSENHKAELGVFIGDNTARGKGYGTLAIEKLLEYAFTNLKLHKVFLRVFKKNEIAIRSYEKTGFVKEGCFCDDVCIDGLFYDVVFMGITVTQWMQIDRGTLEI